MTLEYEGFSYLADLMLIEGFEIFIWIPLINK